MGTAAGAERKEDEEEEPAGAAEPVDALPREEEKVGA